MGLAVVDLPSPDLIYNENEKVNPCFFAIPVRGPTIGDGVGFGGGQLQPRASWIAIVPHRPHATGWVLPRI